MAEQIVLVEDDDALSNALVFGLGLEGFHVQAHKSASSVCVSGLPKVGCLVIDYRLPGENGLSLLARLREGGVTLPAIVITSHASPLTQQRTNMLSATLVEKPLLGDALLSAIRGALTR